MYHEPLLMLRMQEVIFVMEGVKPGTETVWVWYRPELVGDLCEHTTMVLEDAVMTRTSMQNLER
jgi:hypothetical protein